MSKLYVDYIYPQSGNEVILSGNLQVSGTLKAYTYETITVSSTNYAGSNTFGNSSGDTHEFTGSLYMEDDAKLYFGTNQDASIEYDEDGTDELIISGAVGGMSILGPLSSTDSVTIGSAAGSLVTVDTSNMVTIFNESARVADDKKLYFGTGEDASVEYDEDGTDRLTVSGSTNGIDITGSTYFASGSHVVIDDDSKLYFGKGLDAYISYDEATSNELVVSGALGGVDFRVPVNVSDAYTFSADGDAYITISTVGGGQTYTQFNKPAAIVDDVGLYFGTGFDISLEYDEDGTNTLLCDGAAAGVGLTMADDVFLYFGTALDAKMYYDEASADELVISGALGGFDIQLPVQVADAFTVGDESGAYFTVNTVTNNTTTQFNKPVLMPDDTEIYFGTDYEAKIGYAEASSDRLTFSGSHQGLNVTGSTYFASGSHVVIGDDSSLYFGKDLDVSITYDEKSTDRLILTPPPAGMSIGPGFHRVAQDVNVNKADSTDNTVAVQLQSVFIPNNSIITKVVAIPSDLSNLSTALYNLQISATNGTAADTGVATGTEILGAGASDTEDSDGGSASDVIMSSGGVSKRVWINETNIKTTYDAFVYVANAGTGNGTTDPSQGTLHVIIEYYGLE